jgi:hypothetical protein
VLRRLRRFVALSGADRSLLARAFVWLAIADVALRLRLEGLDGWATSSSRTPEPASAAAFARAARYARWLHTAANHHPLRAECLHRSLVLHWWLRREGVASSLQIGVRKEDGELRAHAWIELNGHVINDQPAAVARFTPLGRGRGADLIHATSQSAWR